MDSYDEFHVVEKDGKVCWVYQHPKYQSILQTQSRISPNECPLKIKHPYHPQHYLQPYFFSRKECLCCGRRARGLVYSCTGCQVFMHPICAMETVPLVIDPPKRHDHPLTFFPRQTSLICNVCGLLEKLHPTYICAKCNFVAHNDCMNSPNIIKISRHHHRISYNTSLTSGEWSCGVCRQSIDGDYGAYTCAKCCDYAAHVRCALGKDVCDGIELEGVPEDDMTQDVGPFDMISEGVILYYLHDYHHLHLEVSILFDENKLCQACVLPIFEGKIYSCTECGFILHEACANLPRIIQHALHPHPLTLKAICRYNSGRFQCNACGRNCSGFVYECRKGECTFDLDMRCALVSEPFEYKIHEHPLFLGLDLVEKPICQVCNMKCFRQINCFKCDFIVCFKCITLPYKARYKHDKHFLTILYGEEVPEKDWCEICEGDLGDTNTKVFYSCNECGTFFHIECLFDGEPYFKHGQLYRVMGKEFQIIDNNRYGTSPLFCNYCKNRCHGKIFKTGELILCSRKCVYKSF